MRGWDKMGASVSGGSYISSSADLIDGCVTEAKLAAEACSAAKMKKEGTATHVLTSNGAGAVPSYQAVGAATATYGSPVIALMGNTTAVQGTWTLTRYDDYIWGDLLLTNNVTRAQNDELTIKTIYLTAGTYTLNTYCKLGPDCGIGDFKLDGTSVGTQDFYAAGTTAGSIMQTTGINVAASGIKVLSMKLATKNGASTHYNSYLAWCELIRTA
jgi:hypothetical protein